MARVNHLAGSMRRWFYVNARAINLAARVCSSIRPTRDRGHSALRSIVMRVSRNTYTWETDLIISARPKHLHRQPVVLQAIWQACLVASNGDSEGLAFRYD